MSKFLETVMGIFT